MDEAATGPQCAMRNCPDAPDVQYGRVVSSVSGRIRGAGATAADSADTGDLVTNEEYTELTLSTEGSDGGFGRTPPVISGTGISQIKRRSGIPAVELTAEAAQAAIADAGLTPADIDAICTLGDTPAAEAAVRLGIPEPAELGKPFGPSGLLTPWSRRARR